MSDGGREVRSDVIDLAGVPLEAVLNESLPPALRGVIDRFRAPFTVSRFTSYIDEPSEHVYAL
ncbi:hypothetical protein [Actinoplanes sp. NPDC026619]|uniref:hypothetical protein n=1 Tax=Actinoplanes sp. NPDC026619 TaxID=3155798 RepID=UPI0034098DD5